MGTAIYHDYKSPRRSPRPPHSFTTLIPCHSLVFARSPFLTPFICRVGWFDSQSLSLLPNRTKKPAFLLEKSSYLISNMYAKNIVATSALVAAVAAVPMAKRDIVWETETHVNIVTVPATTTVWVNAAGEPVAAPTTRAHFGHGHHDHGSSAEATTTSAAPVETSSSSSVYVAPTTSSTSVYVAPTTSSTSEYVAPTT